MIVRQCDVPDCHKESPFKRQKIEIPVLSEAVHDRYMLGDPKIVMKTHDLCEDHYYQMIMNNLFVSELDVDANYMGILIPEVER